MFFSVSDVTAIWNTNAVFAYVIAVKIFGLKWEARRLFAVLLATIGVIVVVYGGSILDKKHTNARLGTENVTLNSETPSAPLAGDLLTLVASIGYGLYQVLYKKYAALSTEPEIVTEQPYEQIPNEDPSVVSPVTNDHLDAKNITLPFGLHANFLTSCIGLLTFVIMWLPIPLLHYLKVEPFRLPQNFHTVLAIAGISLGGVVFNAGFMVLLGIWGPVITSVGNLLTIVLVFISDMTFGAGLGGVTMWSVVGCSIIVASFTVLAYDMFNQDFRESR